MHRHPVQTVINLNHGILGEPVGNGIQLLTRLIRRELHFISRRQGSKFQKISAVYIAKWLWTRRQIRFHVLHLLIQNEHIVFPGHIRCEGERIFIHCSACIYKNFVCPCDQTQIILYFRGIIHLILPVLLNIRRKNKAQRQCIQVLIEICPAALPQIHHKLRVGHCIGIERIFYGKDAVHKRCASRDAVGVRGGLASKLLKDLR